MTQNCCVICGFCDSEVDRKKYGNYIVYRNGEPVCRACEEDNTMCLDCGIRPSNCTT